MKILCVLLLLVGSTACAQPQETGFVKRQLTFQDTEMCYQVFVPPGYSADKAWPVILFLHGAGERGTDCEEQAAVGLGPAVRQHMQDFPAIVVFPQAPPRSLWIGAMQDMAMAALQQTKAEFNVDTTRIYLTGLSMGGYGTWYLAAHSPGVFAAIAPVCGGVLPPQMRYGLPPEIAAYIPKDKPYETIAAKIGSTPTWIFHGDADDRVPVTESRQMYQALKAAGGDVRYTEYPGVPHNSWGKAYAETGFYEWLFAQRLGNRLSKE